jgi:hypothetical protein
MKIRTLLATTIAAVGLAALSAPTFALPVTFAQFSQSHSGSPFVFTNNTTSPNNLELTATVPVNFEFLVANGAGVPPNTDIAATLVVTAIANPAATVVGHTVLQPFSSITMTFTANTPIHGQTNLLTVDSSTTGTLIGSTGAHSASLNGDSSGGDTVVFSSAFLDFGSTTSRDFDLSFSSLNPALTVAPNTTGHKVKGYPESFTTSGTGTFGSDPAPSFGEPEPSPALALLVGGLGLTLLFVRNRKIATARPLTA